MKKSEGEWSSGVQFWVWGVSRTVRWKRPEVTTGSVEFESGKCGQRYQLIREGLWTQITGWKSEAKSSLQAFFCPSWRFRFFKIWCLPSKFRRSSHNFQISNSLDISALWRPGAEGCCPGEASCTLNIYASRYLPVALEFTWTMKQQNTSGEGYRGRRGPVEVEGIGQKQEEDTGQARCQKVKWALRLTRKWGGSRWDENKEQNITDFDDWKIIPNIYGTAVKSTNFSSR